MGLNPEVVLVRTTSGTEAKASIRVTDSEDFKIAVKDGSGSTIDAFAIDTGTGNITASGTVAATSYTGDGSNLTNLPAGAPVGGASTNTVFFENDKAVAVNYQITSTKNAMSAGPISINAGIAVTVPSGCSWTIV